MHEVYSIIETVFSKTGSFAPARPVKKSAIASSARGLQPARHAKTPVFIGEMAEEEFEVRLAAD